MKYKGKGAQVNTSNKFQKSQYCIEHIEGVDEELIPSSPDTKIYYENPKTIVNKVNSPDIGVVYSMNPYQGCEHGCIYCYARNTHEYWGFSAGIDFESKIIVKENAPQVLMKQLSNPKWRPYPIMLSGNTDCYQPLERKLKITRKILEVLLKYKHPVSIITKNSLILRDLDILEELQKLNLVNVNISITSLSEETRKKLEPRTVTAKKRLAVIKQLSKINIPVNVMVAPVIPGINSHEIPEIIKQAAYNGASSAAHTIVRLNGSIGEIFKDWILKAFPDKAEKVLNQIASCHGGQINDSRYKTRIKGEGNMALMIGDMVKLYRKKYMGDKGLTKLNTAIFDYRATNSQLTLF